MCKFTAHRRVGTVAPTQVQEESSPVTPSVDAEAIRKQLAELARGKGTAHKVFETLLSGTRDNSYDYGRAQSRDSQEGVVRRFSDGSVSNDYNPSVDGRPQFDFSETQDVVTHTERSVQTTRGLLGRVRQHVVEQQVQTLVSEKVRFDFSLSDKLDIKVGQNDTVFVSGALQSGSKEINLTQRGGEGSLAIVLGKDQILRDISYDSARNCATIVTDRAVFTINGVTNPEGVLVGQEGIGQGTAGFVPVHAVATALKDGKRELFAADKKTLEEAVGKAYGSAAGVLRAASDVLSKLPKPSASPAVTGSATPPPVDSPAPQYNEKALVDELRCESAAIESRIDALTKQLESTNQHNAKLEGRLAALNRDTTPSKPNTPAEEKKEKDPLVPVPPPMVGAAPSSIAPALGVALGLRDSRIPSEPIPQAPEPPRAPADAPRPSPTTPPPEKGPEVRSTNSEPVKEEKPTPSARPEEAQPKLKPTSEPQERAEARPEVKSPVESAKPTPTPTPERIETPKVNSAPQEVGPKVEARPTTLVWQDLHQSALRYLEERDLNRSPKVNAGAEVEQKSALKQTTPMQEVAGKVTPSPTKMLNDLLHETGRLTGKTLNGLMAPKEGASASLEPRSTMEVWRELYKSALQKSEQGRSMDASKVAPASNVEPRGAVKSPATTQEAARKVVPSPAEVISEEQYRKFIAAENALKSQLGQVMKEGKAASSPEARQLTVSLKTLEQQKEFAHDQQKISSSRRATFELLNEKVDLLERWKAQGEAAPDLEAMRAHRDRLGKSLGLNGESTARGPNPADLVSPESIDLARKSAATATKELAAVESAVTEKWQERLNTTAEKFKTELPKSDFAKNNPMKALTVSLMLSEAVTGALRADYSADGKHSPIPSLVALMSQDVANWTSFTTEQGGIVGSVAAEATQKGLDVATVLGGFYAFEQVTVNTVGKTAAGQALGQRLFGTVGTRVAGVAGVAYHGYSTFADGSFQNMNNTQVVGAVSSPIVGGAVVGGVVAGPVGAGVGAGVGAVGEGVGLAVGYMRLEGEIEQNWNQRAVRDSLKFGRAGYVQSAEVVEERKKATLSADEQQVLEHQARVGALTKILASGEPSTIATLGLKADDRSASHHERVAIAEHNWNRMTELCEGRSWYSRVILGNPLDEVRGVSPRVADDFVAMYEKSKADVRALYDNAMRVSYTYTPKRVFAEFEGDALAADLVSKVTSDMKPIDVLGEMNQVFPGLPEILKHKNARDRLITQLERASGETGRYRKMLDLDTSVQGISVNK